MFFRRKRSGTRDYLQIVENKWEDGKTRQRVVANVGRLEKLQESGVLESLLRSGVKYCNNDKNYFSCTAEDTCLSSHQVGRLLQVSPSTVVGWINKGKLDAFRTPGGHRRITAGNLRRFLEAYEMPIPPVFREADEHDKTIFVLDDQPQVIRSIKRAFELHGGPYSVEGCTDGIEALVLIGAHRPDLVLLDIYMDGLDGIEVCRRLQRMPQLAGLKIVAMTAHPTEEARTRILEAGAMAYWTKPVEVGAIVELLEQQKVVRAAAR